MKNGGIMSEESNKKLEELRQLDPMELMKKKAAAVAELGKQFKLLLAMDVVKHSERLKMGKMMEKVQEHLKNVSMIEDILKEKDF